MVQPGPDAPSPGRAPGTISAEEWVRALDALSVAEGRVGISFIQRHFRSGYTAASLFVERLYQAGAISDIEQDGFRTSLVRRTAGQDGMRYWVTIKDSITRFSGAVAKMDQALIERLGKLLDLPEDLR